MNKKLLIGIGAGVLIYWVWSRNKAGKSLNPFAKSSSFAGDDNFFNVVDPREPRFRSTSSGCQILGSCPHVPVGTLLDSNRIVVSNNPSCVVCPRSNTPTGMPIRG